MSTAIAAMRAGRIDMITDPRGGLTWQDGQSLAKTNPDIQQSMIAGPGSDLELRVDNKPFTDIKVRQALQMAIDRTTIAKTYFGGSVDGVPCGVASPAIKGWATPYAQWSKELQEVYSYNPTKAKQLLAEAGYPNGFKTNCVASLQDDVMLLQVIQAEFKDVGVTMDIKPMDPGSFMDFVMAGKHDQMAIIRSVWALPHRRVSSNVSPPIHGTGPIITMLKWMH